MKTAILPLSPVECGSVRHFYAPPSVDEPFGALDVITRSEMQDWLLAMRARLNRTVLLVTHDMDEAIYLSDRILILNPAPAGIVSEIRIDEKKRDRNWLYEQGELRKTISQKIKGF